MMTTIAVEDQLMQLKINRLERISGLNGTRDTGATKQTELPSQLGSNPGHRGFPFFSIRPN